MISMPREITGRTFLKIGVILLILSIIGLIICFATPWLEIEREGDSETYYYGDFDEDYEDEAGEEYDDYFHGSANNALIGFGLNAIMC